MIESLPAAIAIALSPFPIIPAILLLLTSRPRASAGSFLAGWWLGVGVVTGVAVALADIVQAVETAPTWLDWVRGIAGVLLVAYAIKLWLARGKKTKQPAWLASVQSASPRKALRLGLLLSAANPKIIALGFAGGLTIGGASESLSAEVVGVLFFAAVASISVALPLASYLVLGDRVLTRLQSMSAWLARNNDAVMAVIIFVIGTLLITKAA